MNAPTHPHLLAPVATVNEDYVLLLSAYDYLGLLLDLYGYRSKDGEVEVRDVALTGDKRSLGVLISADAMESMDYAVERADEASRADSAAQGRIERASFDRAMAQLPELTTH